MRGSGFASGPGALRRGCSAPLLSLALPKNDIHVIFGLGVFAPQKPQGMETAGIHADLGLETDEQGNTKPRAPSTPAIPTMREPTVR
jgi:hypothetical protein